MSTDRGVGQARPVGAHEHPADRRGRLLGILLVNLATLTWATNIALGRWMRHDLGPASLAAGRYVVSSMLLALLLSRRPPEARRLEPHLWLLAGMALTGVALFAPALYLGLRYTTTVNATLINGFGPLITGLLAALLIHEPMSRRQVAGAIAGLAGIAILISGGSAEAWQVARVNPGDLIILLAVSLWSLYSVFGRHVMRTRGVLSATALSSFLGTVLLVLFAIVEVRSLPPDVTPQVVLLLVYIGIVPSVGGILAWNAGVQRLGASGAMVFYNTLPLYGALIGFLLLDEPIGPAHLAGGILIVGGGLWAARASRPAAASQTANSS